MALLEEGIHTLIENLPPGGGATRTRLQVWRNLTSLFHHLFFLTPRFGRILGADFLWASGQGARQVCRSCHIRRKRPGGGGESESPP
jgi:hypothetical protein